MEYQKKILKKQNIKKNVISKKQNDVPQGSSKTCFTMLKVYALECKHSKA